MMSQRVWSDCGMVEWGTLIGPELCPTWRHWPGGGGGVVVMRLWVGSLCKGQTVGRYRPTPQERRFSGSEKEKCRQLQLRLRSDITKRV
jgi:hypothetical protein